MASKERITPPSKKELSQAGKLLQSSGTSIAGRVLAEASVARREGVKPRPGKK